MTTPLQDVLQKDLDELDNVRQIKGESAANVLAAMFKLNHAMCLTELMVTQMEDTEDAVSLFHAHSSTVLEALRFVLAAANVSRQTAYELTNLAEQNHKRMVAVLRAQQ